MITDRNTFKKGHITARPSNNILKNDVARGKQPLKLDTKRDGLIYVPKYYNKEKPAALAVMLHGAGGNADHGLSLLRKYADENNIIIVAPESRAATWDIIAADSFGADVIFINQALSFTLETYNIDTSHIAIGGFSDGASYALCIGLSNGDLFNNIIAFSPGFYYTVENKGKPHVFISHGINDRVLPIDPCSRRIVPQLKKLGYNVQYEEFIREHEIPAAISAKAIKVFK
jgi:predicted esterase